MNLEKLANVSSQSVKNATGKNWEDWITFLQNKDAAKFTHKKIVDLLKNETDLSNWWQQKIANGFEKYIGKKFTGKTDESGYQIGVRKTFPVDENKIWDFINSDAGLKLWLGDSIELDKNKSFKTTKGIAGKIKVFKPGSHIRLTYKQKDWNKPSILQVRIIPAKTGTTISFHQEKLHDKKTREKMHLHWKSILKKIPHYL